MFSQAKKKLRLRKLQLVEVATAAAFLLTVFSVNYAFAQATDPNQSATDQHVQAANQQATGTVNQLNGIQSGTDVQSGAGSSAAKLVVGAGGNAAVGSFLTPICITGKGMVAQGKAQIAAWTTKKTACHAVCATTSPFGIPACTAHCETYCDGFIAAGHATELTGIAKMASCPLASMAVAAAGSMLGNAKGADAATFSATCQGSHCFDGGPNPTPDPNGSDGPSPTPDPNYDDPNNPGGPHPVIPPGSLGANPYGGGKGGGPNNQFKGGPAGTLPEVTALEKQIAAAKKTLDQSGLKYDAASDTYTLPDGTKIPGSAYGSTAGLKAAGLNDDQIAKIQDTMKKANGVGEKKMSELEALLQKQGLLGPGGDSPIAPGALSSKHGYGGSGNLGAGDRNLASLDAQGRDVAGLQKQLDGDPIGVAGDNIFHMVTRRYGQIQQEGRVLAVP